MLWVNDCRVEWEEWRRAMSGGRRARMAKGACWRRFVGEGRASSGQGDGVNRRFNSKRKCVVVLVVHRRN